MVRPAPFEPLSMEEVYEIHMASLNVLKLTGLKIYHDETLKLLDEAGAIVDYKTKLVKFPEYVVREALKSCPNEVYLAGRDPKHDLRFTAGPSRVYFGGGVGLNIATIDQEGKKSRRGTLRDLENFVKIGDYLKNFKFHLMPGVTANDVNPHVQELYEFRATIENTTKSMACMPYTRKGAKYCNEMAIAVAGGEKEFRNRPFCFNGYSPTCPLEWGREALNIMMETAKIGMPTMCISESLVGGTSPMTFAGTLVQSNAEALSAIVINQTYSKGLPVFYCVFPYMMDMRTGVSLRGNPGISLTHAAAAQLARHYNLPSVAWQCTDSKAIDAQYGYEKVITSLTLALAGCNMIWGIGNMELEFAVSFEGAVIDDEIIDMVNRVREGIEITEETLALDLIKEVGPGGKYYDKRHTLKYYQKEIPEVTVSDRRMRLKWEELGSKDLFEKAREKVKEIFKTHTPEPLPRDIKKELDDIIKRAERELSG